MAQVPIPQPQPQQFNLDLGQLFNANKPAGSKSLLDALAGERKGKIISLVLADFLPANPMLSGETVLQLEPLLVELGKVGKLDLFLRSTGGVAEIPWRIVSVIRSFCSDFEAIIPRAAMSGATHVAIAADNLVMTPFSYLGSVDPTRNHPLLPRDPQGNLIPASVQDLKHCLEFVKRNVPEGEPFGPIISQLFANVSPLAIGAIEQSYELSRLITNKVLGTRATKLPSDQVDDIVNRLAGKYFSHSYFISCDEVQNDLKLPVTKAEPNDALFKLIESLNSYYTAAFQQQVQVPGAPIPLTFRVTGFVETLTSRRILCQVFGQNNQPVASTWMSETNS